MQRRRLHDKFCGVRRRLGAEIPGFDYAEAKKVRPGRTLPGFAANQHAGVQAGVGVILVNETVVIVITGRDAADRADGHDIGLDAFRGLLASREVLHKGGRVSGIHVVVGVTVECEDAIVRRQRRGG